jgi:quercetin dioxygenase-like cupin family protein
MRTAKLDDIPLGEHNGQEDWLPIRHALGVRAFGINAWRADRGQQVIGEHVEREDSPSEHEELYLVLDGRAMFTVDGETVDAPRGTLVHVPDPGSSRGAVAQEDGTVVLVVGGEPGAAFAVSRWEQDYLGG